MFAMASKLSACFVKNFAAKLNSGIACSSFIYKSGPSLSERERSLHDFVSSSMVERVHGLKCFLENPRRKNPQSLKVIVSPQEN